MKLSIKIYQDRLMRLITSSQNTFLDKILKEFRMGQVKKVVLTSISKKSIELISVQEQWLKQRNGCATYSMPLSWVLSKPELCIRRNVTQVLSKKNMM